MALFVYPVGESMFKTCLAMSQTYSLSNGCIFKTPPVCIIRFYTNSKQCIKLFFENCAIVQKKEANCMELNVREESLKDLFKQFQVEHNENCKTVFIDNNDPKLENYLKTDYIVYLHMVDKEVRHLDLSKVNTIFVNKEYASNLENGIQDEQRILELLLKKYPNLRAVLITDKKGAYYKDKDLLIYQKELVSNFDKDLFLVKYMASELKGNSEMTSLYRGVNQ